MLIGCFHLEIGIGKGIGHFKSGINAQVESEPLQQCATQLFPLASRSCYNIWLFHNSASFYCFDCRYTNYENNLFPNARMNIKQRIFICQYLDFLSTVTKSRVYSHFNENLTFSVRNTVIHVFKVEIYSNLFWMQTFFFSQQTADGTHCNTKDT